MHSLYDVLISQHSRQLMPVRCAGSTIVQLQRYFEDVVLENNLSALVIEALPVSPKRSTREKVRIRELARGARHAFFFVPHGDGITESISVAGANAVADPVILPQAQPTYVNERFIVIADARFSALLATVHGRGNDSRMDGDEVIWTFEPDVVYSALEYLMARVGVEHASHAQSFGSAVRSAMPKATSLQLTVSVTTKMAHLLQEQAAREIAVNRIATTIRESLELGVILQKTVDEVGSALNAASCALRVDGPTDEQGLRYFYFKEGDTAAQSELLGRHLDRHCEYFVEHQTIIVSDSDENGSGDDDPTAVVPLVFHERLMGALQVTSNDRARLWQENEIMLLRTVADQVAVAVNHAWLFAQIQQQALTDALTGCYNRRSFEMQLDKDLLMAKRLHQPLSLIMLDLDRFKSLNDSAGHDAGDAALRQLSNCFREELRGVDTAARFGGDEFVLILPQAYAEGALIVAERVRARIEQITIPGFGNLTSSLGIATFPTNASNRAELLRSADNALYAAKRAGRNRVCIATEDVSDLTIDTSLALNPDTNDTAEEIVM